MKLLYGLALALIFFEGFISQCECKGDRPSTSKGNRPSTSKGNQPSTSKGSTEKQQFNLTKINKTLFGQGGDLPRANPKIEKILENFIIQISPKARKDDEIEVTTDKDGNNYLIIFGADRLQLVLNNFGHLIKKIHVNYEDFICEDAGARSNINRAIATKCTKKLTELKVIGRRRLYLFLEDLRAASREPLCFPNVKTLVYRGVDERTHEFDLKAIFPNVETLKKEEFWSDEELLTDIDGYYENQVTERAKKCSIL